MNKSTALRFIGLLTASVVTGIIAGVLAGVGLYEITYDPNDQQFLANLGQAIISLFVGVLIAYGVYVSIAIKSTRSLRTESKMKRGAFRIAIAPIIFVAVTVGLEFGLNNAALPRVLYYLPYLIALAATVAVIVPVPNKVRAGIGGGLVAIVVAGSIATPQISQASYDQDIRNSYATWNGPLMLVNGNTASIPDASWVPSEGQAPYDNSDYERAQLFWIQGDPNSPDRNVMTASFFNTSAATGMCEYDSCDVVGQSVYGPVFESTSTPGEYGADVPKGHVEVDALMTEHDDGQTMATSIINSLQPVDTATYANVQVELSHQN